MPRAERVELSKIVSLSEAAKRPRKDDKMTSDRHEMTAVMTISTPFDDDTDDTDYKWSAIRDRLDLGSNVANARWMPEKLLPLFAALDAPALLTAKGKPTKFCAQMLARYKAVCVDGNDYDWFCNQVRSAFAGDTAKPVHVEVLTDDDADDKPSSLVIMQQQVEAKNDTLESRIALAMQSKQQAAQAETQYRSLSDKSWEQQVIEDELAAYQEEQERKKREYELRVKVRQMLDKQAQDSQ